MAELKDLIVNGQSHLIGDVVYKTHTAGDNSNKLASTAYVKNAIDALPVGSDTKNTTGSTNKASTKLYIVGAENQADNPVTYSNTNVYIGTDNKLYSNGSAVLTSFTESDPTVPSHVKNITSTLISNWDKGVTSTNTLGTGDGEIIIKDGSTNNRLVKASGKTITTTVNSASTNSLIPTAKAVWDALDALPDPMVFKGTVGTDGTIEWDTLPTASTSNAGWTYKVITDHSTAPICKVGDTIISNGSAWVVIPSGDDASGTVTNIATGSGLTGGPITTSGTISHADTSSQSSVSTAASTFINGVTLDTFGHVTGLSTGALSTAVVATKAASGNTVVTGVTSSVSVLTGVAANGTVTLQKTDGTVNVVTSVSASDTATVLTGVKASGSIAVVTAVSVNTGAMSFTHSVSAEKLTLSCNIVTGITSSVNTAITGVEPNGTTLAVTDITDGTKVAVIKSTATPATVSVLTGVKGNGTATVVSSLGTTTITAVGGTVTAYVK